MKRDDVEVGETYLFIGSDSPKRKHLAGQAFTVVSKDRVYRKVSYRYKKRSMKVTRFFNDAGVGARAEELEPLPKEGFFYCKTCEKWYPDYETHSNVPILENATAGKPFTTCSVCGTKVGEETPPEDSREFPCTECETGEMQFYSGGGPSGISTYQCTECGHQTTFP